MGKKQKVLTVRGLLKKAMPKIVISNDAQYGGDLAENASPVASLASALLLEAKRRKKVRVVDATGMPGSEAARKGGVTKQDWIIMGQGFSSRLDVVKDGSLNAVCDTLSAFAIFVLDGQINMPGTKIELVHNPSPTHHHFVVVDRADGSDLGDRGTWGAKCFVVDLWHAKRAGLDAGAGVFDDLDDHPYSGSEYVVVLEHTWIKT